MRETGEAHRPITEPCRRKHRSLAPAETQSARGIGRRGAAPAGGAMGRAGPRGRSGALTPTANRARPKRHARVPAGRVAASPVATGPAATSARGPRPPPRQDPRPQAPEARGHHRPTKRRAAAGPKKTKGAGEGPDALRYSYDWTCGPRATLRGRWDQSGVARGGGPVWIRWTDPANVRPSGRPPPGSRKNYGYLYGPPPFSGDRKNSTP